MRCRATAFAFDLSTIPLHSRWPLFEVSASTWRPSGSSASAKYSPSSTQKSRLNRRFRSAASRSSLSASSSSLPDRAARGARRAPSRRTRSPGARRSPAGSRAACRRGTRSSPTSPSSTGSRGPSPRCAACTRCTRAAREVRVLVDPVQRRARLDLELAHERAVAGPALVLVEQDDVQRRRVGGAVVRRVRALLERRHLPVAHLVEDPPGVLVAEVVGAGRPASRRARAASSRRARA